MDRDRPIVRRRKERVKMLIMNNKDFEGSAFAIQLVAKGSYVDNGVGDGKSYLIETYVIRLNHVAHNEWILSEVMSSPDAFNSREGWEAYIAKYNARRETWNSKIVDSLGIDGEVGGICITQSQSEVFTVVHIRELS
jgi:predicted ATPase